MCTLFNSSIPQLLTILYVFFHAFYFERQLKLMKGTKELEIYNNVYYYGYYDRSYASHYNIVFICELVNMYYELYT